MTLKLTRRIYFTVCKSAQQQLWCLNQVLYQRSTVLCCIISVVIVPHSKTLHMKSLECMWDVIHDVLQYNCHQKRHLLKGQFTQWIFCDYLHPHVIPNPSDFLSFVEHNRRNVAECSSYSIKVLCVSCLLYFKYSKAIVQL